MNIRYKKFISLFVTFNFLFSVSAPPLQYDVSQPDGRKIPVRMFGHEYYNWMETEDGYVIDWVEDETRLGWYYRDLDSEGRYFPTNIMVDYPSSQDVDIPKRLREIFPKVRELDHYKSHSIISQSTSLDRSSSSTTIKRLLGLIIA